MVSFIIPVYNAENNLKECISSVNNQTNKNFEIILINDGSKDKSLNICKDFSNRFPNITTKDIRNEGVSNARNIGKELAKGSWICFVDADDIVSNSYVELIESNSSNSDILIFSGNISTTEDLFFEEKESSRIEMLNSIFGISIIKEMNNIRSRNVWSKAYKRSLIDGILFNTDIGFGEDALFNMDTFIKAKNIRFINTSVYQYRVTPNSITNGFQKNLIDQKMNYINLLFKKLESSNLLYPLEYGFITSNISSIKDIFNNFICSNYNINEQYKKLTELNTNLTYISTKKYLKQKFSNLNKSDKLFVFIINHRLDFLLIFNYSVKKKLGIKKIVKI